MPAFGRVYRPEDLHDVAAYILEELVDQQRVSTLSARFSVLATSAGSPILSS